MSTATVLFFPERTLLNASKRTLINMVLTLRAKLAQNAEIIKALEETLALRDLSLAKIKEAEINKTANQPSSKQPEFNKNTGAETDPKKKKRKKKRNPRAGAGNRPKPAPDVTHENPLNACPQCGENLTEQAAAEKVSRIVEDIPAIPEKSVVFEEVQERKWCFTCKEMVSSTSEAALPRSDIGLRTTVLVAYFWVISAMSLPGIARFLQSFFRLTLSTAGLSKMMIRLGNIMKPVHDEILQDVKGGNMIFADETGWRVKGVLWWLWIFANKHSAYYWPDRKRGSAVVEKILGSIFSGVLITDAWHAYMKIICMKQTCMAHILRKIRKFRESYPEHYCIVSFHQKLRRILTDGEKLQLTRKELGEEVFARRLKYLKERLDKLLAWESPNDILKTIIKKVARQKEYILTFVEHEGVPNHNNYSEYIIKKGILKRKVSGGSMSDAGFMAYAVLQSIAQTCHLRKISFTGFLLASLLHYIRKKTPLLLSQYDTISLDTSMQKKAA